MIKLITFDISGVVTDKKLFYDDFLTKLTEFSRAEEFIVSEYFFRAMKNEYDKREISFDDLISELAKTANNISVKDVLKILYESLSVQEEVLDFVASTKDKYKTSFISNRSRIVIDAIEKVKGKKYFDFGISAMDFSGISKPDPRMYDAFQEKLVEENILPEEILFIDDTPINLVPAKNLNWQTHLYTDLNSMKKVVESV